MHKLYSQVKSLRAQLAREDLTHPQHETLSPVFIPEKLTFSHCLRTENAPKKLLIRIGGRLV